MQKKLDWICIILTPLLLTLSIFYPALNFLTWVALIPLFNAIHLKQPSHAFLRGWVAGAIFFSLLLYWMAIPILDYGGNYAYIGMMGLLFAFTIMGIFWGIFALSTSYFMHIKFPLILWPALWTLIEVIRINLMPFLPLGMVGHSQAFSTYTVQLGDLFGTPGISFLIVFFNAMIFFYIKQKISLTFFIPLLSALILITTIYAVYSINALEESHLEAGLIQANIPQHEKRDPSLQDRNLNIHMDLSKDVRSQSDMIIWPETSIPFDPINNEEERTSFAEIIKPLNVPLFAGLFSRNGSRNEDCSQLYNKVALFKDGKPNEKYRKMWLVPFGEYLPFPLIFEGIYQNIDISLSQVTPGEDINVFQLNEITWAAPICYEILNSGLIREMATKADMIITLSNEAWFRDSKGLSLLWGITVMRAVEFRTPILKVANTGYSGFINALGHAQTLPANTRVSQTITIKTHKTYSPYSHMGDLPFICILLLIIIAHNPTKFRAP